MAFDRQAALAAGYTEEEIDEFLRKQQQTQAPGAAPGAEPPPPSTVIAEVPSGITSPAGLATTGLGIAEVAVPAALGVATYKAGEYGVKKLGEAFRGGPAPTTPVAPAPTPAAPATSPILGANGQPMTRTPTPTPTPKPQAQPGVIDKATAMVRQLAASRILPTLARAGGTVTAAVMPGNVGQNYPFPQSGPMRGQEINPSTGRPWTKQELDAYRAQYGG